jgi:hypothetical protein
MTASLKSGRCRTCHLSTRDLSPVPHSRALTKLVGVIDICNARREDHRATAEKSVSFAAERGHTS